MTNFVPGVHIGPPNPLGQTQFVLVLETGVLMFATHRPPFIHIPPLHGPISERNFGNREMCNLKYNYDCRK